MAIDHNHLVHIAHELKSLDQQREKLLAELQRIAGGGIPNAPRRGRPPRASAAPGRARPVVPGRNGRRKKGLTTAIMDHLEGTGAAYTAGDIVRDLKLPKTKGQIASVSTTLVRLAKEGRVKKDEERGYLVG
jgi:hypothetical protein